MNRAFEFHFKNRRVHGSEFPHNARSDCLHGGVLDKTNGITWSRPHHSNALTMHKLTLQRVVIYAFKHTNRSPMNINRVVHQCMKFAPVHNDPSFAIGKLKSIVMPGQNASFLFVWNNTHFFKREAICVLRQNPKTGVMKHVHIFNACIPALRNENARVIALAVAQNKKVSRRRLASELSVDAHGVRRNLLKPATATTNIANATAVTGAGNNAPCFSVKLHLAAPCATPPLPNKDKTVFLNAKRRLFCVYFKVKKTRSRSGYLRLRRKRNIPVNRKVLQRDVFAALDGERLHPVMKNKLRTASVNNEIFVVKNEHRKALRIVVGCVRLVVIAPHTTIRKKIVAPLRENKRHNSIATSSTRLPLPARFECASHRANSVLARPRLQPEIRN